MKQNKLQHIAIILDGNRTWASEKGLPKFMGHTEGAKNIKRIVTAAIDLSIPYLTLYTLSTENLQNRSEKELKHLFSLFEKLEGYLDLFQKHGVKAHMIGNLAELPKKVQTVCHKIVTETQDNTNLTLTFAVNYGGRDEIIRSIQKIDNLQDITETSFAKYLDTAGLPDVDLLIRTGGYQRLSNFLPWQSTYAELYFTETRWPAFSEENFKEAIEWFHEQKRKKGK